LDGGVVGFGEHGAGAMDDDAFALDLAADFGDFLV
jgi:hypothetical protein